MKRTLMKQKNKSIQFIFTALLVFTLFFSFGIKPTALGEDTTDLAKLKQEKQKKLDEVLKKIADYSAEIKLRRSQTNSLKNEIAIINLEIVQTEAQIDATVQRIDQTNLQIAEVTDQIIKTENDIGDQKILLKELIGEINDLDQRTPLEIALENDNFQQFLDQVQYLTSIQERSQDVLTKIKALKIDLEIEQTSLKKQKSDLDDFKTSLALAQAGLTGQRQAKQQVLDQTRGQEKVYQKLLSESQNLEDQIGKEIFDLEVEIRKKMGNNRLPSIKGILAWPMDGVLTQGYGNTGFTALGYNYHNGIDLAGPAGTPIYSAADGEVIDTGSGAGAYGNWVAIKHNVPTKSGNRALITLYAHMSSYRMKVGQVVKQGDLVGFEGNTGNTTRLLYGPHRGYHLHFTVFDADGYGVSEGKYPNIYGSYRVPYGYTYNPLEFL